MNRHEMMMMWHAFNGMANQIREIQNANKNYRCSETLNQWFDAYYVLMGRNNDLREYIETLPF